jgi:hypothetical protein
MLRFTLSLALIGSNAPAQDAMALLKKVVETQASVQTFELESQTLVEMNSGSQVTRSEYMRHWYGARPGKFRLEERWGLRINDGRQTWEYRERTNEYLRDPWRGDWLTPLIPIWRS